MKRSNWLAMTLILVLLLGVLTGCKASSDSSGEENSHSNTNELWIETTPPEKRMTDKEKAFYLFNENLESFSSYTVDMTLSATGTMQGMPFSVTGGGKMIMIDTPTELFYYEDATEHFDIGNGTFVQDIVMKSGYVNGKMFSYQSSDGETDGVYSTLTDAEWRAYEKEKTEDEDLILSEELVGSVTLTTTEEGYTATFTDFTEKGLSEMDNAYGDLSSVMGDDPSDVVLTISVDAEKKPLSMTVQFLYEGGTDAPTFVMDGIYRDVNQTKSIAVDLSGYRNVGDLRVIERAERELGKITEASAATWKSYESCVMSSGGTQVSSSDVTVNASFTDDKDGYRFSLTDSKGAKARYENGMMYSQSAGQREQSSACDEQTARSYLNDTYVDFAGLSVHQASGVTKTENGYEITLSDVDLSMFDSMLEGGNQIDDLLGVVTVEWKEGKLAYLSYEISFELITPQGTVSVNYLKDIASIQYTE